MTSLESDAAVPIGAPALSRRAIDRGLESLEPRISDRIGSSPEVLHRDKTFRRSLAVADAVAASGAVVATFVLAGDASLRPTALLMVPTIIVLAKIFGLYDREDLVLRKSTLEETPALLQLATIFVVLAWFGQDALSAEPLTRAPGALLWL